VTVTLSVTVHLLATIGGASSAKFMSAACRVITLAVVSKRQATLRLVSNHRVGEYM
jgi:hypothetical protein